MTLKLYMDVHVPMAVTEGLRLRGVDVLTCYDDETTRATDAEVLQRATILQRVLFTQDSDLLQIAAAWQAADRPFPGVIYCHQLAASIGRLVFDLELLALLAADTEILNRVVYLPL